MAKPIQIEAEVQVPRHETSFTSDSKGDPDTIFIVIVLLLVCTALALLADAII